MKTSMTLALLSSLVACSTATPAAKQPVVSSVAAPDVSFASYHTFGFGLAREPRPGYEVTPRSLEVQRRLQALVKTALEDRGLTETTDKPDLIVKLATGSGSSANPAPERGPSPAVGFIGIDVFASASGSQIWQGSAFAEIDPMKIDDALLQRGVDHMLDGFGSVRGESVAKAP